MKLLAQGFSSNGVLKGTIIAVDDDDSPMGFEDVVNLSNSKDRTKLEDNLMAEFNLSRDEAKRAVRNLLVSVRSTANQFPEESTSEGAEPEYAAKFPGLVDLVDDGTGVKFLVLEEGNLILRNQVVLGDRVLVPPPAEAIQWLLPRAANVYRSYEQDTDANVFSSLNEYLESISSLPSSLHYTLVSVWVVHTYLLEHFNYSPQLLLWAVPERGKSRTLRGATYAAYRGLITETLQEANVFRWSNDLGATLAFDVRDLWKKAEKRGSDDILLQRFERGAMVARVLWPERGQFRDTRYFDVFGATIIAANEMPGEPNISRCVTITMPEASLNFPNNVEARGGLPLRERLVALRARWLSKMLPDAPKPVRGRLGDILQPFAQVATMLGPDIQHEFAQLALNLYRERMEDRATSREARTVLAVEFALGGQEDGKLPIESITQAYNQGLKENQQISNESMGRRLKALGFQRDRLKNRKRAIVADSNLLESLIIKYGLKVEDFESSQQPSDPPSCSVQSHAPQGQSADSSHPKRSNCPGVEDRPIEVSDTRPDLTHEQNGQLDSSDSLGQPPEMDICLSCRQSVPVEEVGQYLEDGILCINCADTQ